MKAESELNCISEVFRSCRLVKLVLSMSYCCRGRTTGTLSAFFEIKVALSMHNSQAKVRHMVSICLKCMSDWNVWEVSVPDILGAMCL